MYKRVRKHMHVYVRAYTHTNIINGNCMQNYRKQGSILVNHIMPITISIT